MRPGAEPETPLPAVPRAPRSWSQREAQGWELLAEGEDHSALVARLLASRKVRSPEEAVAWLQSSLKDLPNPAQLSGMTESVDRVLRAMDDGELICVHGDYDADGCTSVALLVGFLREVGASVTWYAPHRHRDGYGVALHTVERLADEGVKLIITCDTGVSAHAAIARGNDLGIDTLVCDHHTPPPELPNAHAIINPRLDGENSPFWELAAVGVCFMLAVSLRAKLRARGAFSGGTEPDLRNMLDIVALGTVADLAPLRGVNRLLVSSGLRVLKGRRRTGLDALLTASGIRPGDPIEASHLGFRLGPRINAAGRLAEAARSVDLLLSDDPAEARSLAEELDAYNAKRQDIERRTFSEALKQIQADPDSESRKGLVLWSEEWHSGVVGIVAGRIAQHVNKPTLVLAVKPGEGEATGSGRAIPGVDLFSALKANEHLLVRFGGHRAAAGLTIQESNLSELRSAFSGPAFSDDDPECWEGRLSFDAELALADIDWNLHGDVDQLAPFGIGNAQPLFVLRGATARRVKALRKGGLRMELHDGSGRSIDAVGFGLGVRPEDIDGPVDVAFHLQENHWKGVTSLEIRIRDLRLST